MFEAITQCGGVYEGLVPRQGVRHAQSCHQSLVQSCLDLESSFEAFASVCTLRENC